MKASFLFVLLVAVGCTKPNPATCCLDSADCASAGFDGVRECAPGLACVNHECEVPKCSTTGCGAEQPVCNITTDVCEGCASSDDCDRFTSSPTCNTTTGACVECVASTDCTAPTKAICDNQVCRGCVDDMECTSGACGDDGACVEESGIVYLDPGGMDQGTCSKAAPCRTLAYSVGKTSAARSHIVMAKGGYLMESTRIDATTTSAHPLYIHGGGAAISQSGESPFLTFEVPVVIRHIDLDSHSNTLVVGGVEPSLVEDVRIHSGFIWLYVQAPVTARDLLVENTAYGINVGSTQLTLDRAKIFMNENGLRADGAAVVNGTNLLLYGSRLRAIEWTSGTGGTIAFSTIADSGSGVTAGPRGVACANGMTLKSVIVWVPGADARVPFENCNVVNTIAGPSNAAGATNVDPKFVDVASHDYHISSTSVARDAVDEGPGTDFEGDARPRGAKFDIGADEAP